MAENKIVKTFEIEGEGLNKLIEQSKQLKEELRSAGDIDTFIQLKQEAQEVDDKINSINESIGSMQNPLNGVGETFEQMRESVVKLDFGRLSAQAKDLATKASAISFKGAVTTIKQMGSAFLNIGKALLTNPIFLLATAITLIVIAIVDLLKKMGLFQKVLDVLMAPLNLIIDLFYKLTDAIGLTTIAAQESAKEVVDAAESKAKAYESSSKSIIQSLDNEIRMAELNGESTVDLEREKQKALVETARLNAAAEKARYQEALLNKELTAKEIADIKEKAKQSRLAYQQTISDMEYFEAKVKKTTEDTNKKNKEDASKANADAAKERATAAAKRAAAAKTYADNRLSFERSQRDLELELMEEGSAKDLALNQEKYKRLIEDTLSSETLLETEKEKLIKQFEDLRSKNEGEIIKKTQDELNAKKLEAEKTYQDLLFSQREESIGKTIEIFTREKDETIAIYKKQLEDGLITEEQFNERKLNAENQYQKNLASIKGKYIEQSPEEKLELDLQNLKDLYDNDLINFEEYLKKKKELEDKYNEESSSAQESAEDKKKAKRNEIMNASFDALSSVLGAMQEMNEANLAADLAANEGNEEKMEQIRKESFEKNKKLQIASATVQMIQGAISAFSGAMSLGPVAGPIVGAALAASVVMSGMANIKKIKASKYESPNSGSPDTGSASTASIAERTTPNVSFMGSAGNYNKVNANGNSDSNQNIVIENTVKVSESDITGAQKTVANLKSNASL